MEHGLFLTYISSACGRSPVVVCWLSISLTAFKQFSETSKCVFWNFCCTYNSVAISFDVISLSFYFTNHRNISVSTNLSLILINSIYVYCESLQTRD